MKKDIFVNNLINFIKNSTCSFTCVKTIKEILDKEGYIELYEHDVWEDIPNKFYVTRNDASIIAMDLNDSDIFNIITSHCDTPALELKANGAYIKENYLKYNIMPYGGLLNLGWLDHPLSLAGKVIYKKDNKLNIKIVDFNKPMLVVPSVAIHQDAKANTNLDLNMQIDLQPIVTISDKKDDWNTLLKDELKEEIVDFDLLAYNPSTPVLIGKDNELLVSPRIDNITSVYASLESFLNSTCPNIKVFCTFNNEEIGSLTEEGADSSFLLDILKRVAGILKIDISSTLAKSFIISSDNTHAVHPNHTEYADDTGSSYLNKGFTIVKESTSTTNAISSSIIKELCHKHKIKYQDATAKNDISGGSTLSGISLRHVSVLSIDVGVCELSMHSSVETCSINDVYELYKMMKAFYNSKIEVNKNEIKIIS